MERGILDRYQRVERALRTNVRVNRALLQAPGEAELMAEVCRVAVEEAGYRLAWVGYAESDPQKTVRPVAQHGFDDGYVGRAGISWEDDERGRGPTGTAIRTGQPQLAQHIATDARFAPWRADALRRGYGASAALPLLDGGVAFGTLNLYAKEPHAFDQEELELLTLVASDLSHGVRCARGKAMLAAFQDRIGLANRMDIVGRTAAAIAHDINNSLAVAMLCVGQLAEEKGAPDPTLVADAMSGLERASALNRRLLDAARPPRDTRVFSIDEALERIVPTLARASGRDVGVDLELGAPDATIRMNGVMFEQLVSNLVLNARDATPPGGRITVATRELELHHPLGAEHLGMSPGPYVELRVTDTGHGIAPENVERVFEPFFTTKGTTGTGLGLTTALGVVRQAGGKISLSTELGKGTTFTVLLPRTPSA